MASYLDEFLNKPRTPGKSSPFSNFIDGLYNPEQIVELENKFGNAYQIGNSAAGPLSDARHMAAMNNLSNSLSPMNNGIGNFIGDTGAFLAGAINEIPALGRGFNKENLGEIGEDIIANFKGSFGTPNSTTAEDIYSQVFTGTVPERFASGTPIGYGAAQASDLTSLERDFPGMSTGDIIDSMNNRAFIGRQITPMAKPNVVDPNRIPGRIQEAVEPQQYRIRDQLARDFLQGGILKDARKSLGETFGPITNKIGSGLGSLKDFAIDKGRIGRNLLGSAGAMALGLPGIVGSGLMSLMGGLGNAFEDRQLSGDTIDEYGNVYSADELNSQNALGGYYTDAARSARRRTSRISKMRARDFNNKKISQTNLDRLVRQEKAQQAAREAATAARAMARNPQVYANAGITSGGFASQNTGTNQSFSNKSGRGRTGYQEGGLASMFTRI